MFNILGSMCCSWGHEKTRYSVFSPIAQVGIDSFRDALRERVIQAVRGGMSQAEAARVFGVSRQSVNKWYG